MGKINDKLGLFEQLLKNKSHLLIFLGDIQNIALLCCEPQVQQYLQLFFQYSDQEAADVLFQFYGWIYPVL